jgi:hypothetical protein
VVPKADIVDDGGILQLSFGWELVSGDELLGGDLAQGKRFSRHMMLWEM